jgi:NADPH:quinone reductase-like Zn-dependent oxidoreductase
LSTADVIFVPWNCSGANQVGVPATNPVIVSAVASEEKHDFCQKLGASMTIDYKKESFSQVSVFKLINC